MDIFDEELIFEEEETAIEQCKSIKEAFFKSYRKSHIFDLTAIMNLSNSTYNEVIKELQPILILDPESNEYVFIDDYFMKNKYELLLLAKEKVKEGIQVYQYNIDLLKDILIKNAALNDYEYKCLRELSNSTNNLQQIRYGIGYLPASYRVEQFINNYDFIQMLIKPHTMFINTGISALMDAIKLFDQYFPEKQIYIAPSSFYKDQIKHLFKKNTKVKIISEAAISKIKEDSILMIYDLSNFKSIKKILNSSQEMIIFNQALPLEAGLYDLVRFFRPDYLNMLNIHNNDELEKYVQVHGCIDLQMILHHCLFDYTNSDGNFEIEDLKNDIINYNSQLRSAKNNLIYNKLGKNQLRLIEKQLNYLGSTTNMMNIDCKLLTVVNKVNDLLYEYPDQKQVIFCEENTSISKIDYYKLIKSRIFIDSSQIQIVENHQIDFNKRVYISSPRDLKIDELKNHRVTVHSLDVPNSLTKLRSMFSQNTTFYYYPFTIDQSDQNNLIQTLYKAYMLTRNTIYLKYIHCITGDLEEINRFEKRKDYSYLF